MVIPTDTVYGLGVPPDERTSVRALSALKRRSPDQPIAVVGASAAALCEQIPELAASSFGRHLVVPNPARRLPWLTGARPETIGVRLPVVTGRQRSCRRGRRHRRDQCEPPRRGGSASPRKMCPMAILDEVAAVLDGGELGKPSTVLDLTGSEPCVLREGAVPAAEALARVAE